MENISKKSLRYKYFKELLKHGPISWSLIRATELEVLSQVKFHTPILEIACGDGTFSQLLFRKKAFVDAGIDIKEREIKEAQKLSVFKKVLVADARKLPFKNESFSCVFSNGSLEHITNIDKVLKEIGRVLKRRGTLVITVPSSNFRINLLFYRIFSKLGLKKFAQYYSVAVNAAFAHKNLWTPAAWDKKLNKYQMHTIKYVEYNSTYNVFIHEIFFATAIPSIILKKITGRFFIFDKLRIASIPFIFKFMLPILKRDNGENPCSLLIIAIKND